MAKTKIEWCDKVWNPTTGCSKISAGCANCYAERIANRFWGDRKFTDVRCHSERLNEPLNWRKPQKIFVNSMSDLFHEDVPFSFVEKVWDIMFDATILHNHIFMILTKRPKRMLEFSKWMNDCRLRRIDYPGVWLGVTVENQRTADERIPILLDILAVVRFVSIEPMLGPVDLTNIKDGFVDLDVLSSKLGGPNDSMHWTGGKIDWIICGPETGPGARPIKSKWILDLYRQCADTGVPFFDKRNTLGLNLQQFPCGAGK
jgi:protein gp37